MEPGETTKECAVLRALHGFSGLLGNFRKAEGRFGGRPHLAEHECGSRAFQCGEEMFDFVVDLLRCFDGFLDFGS